jgi:hypothetical protein
MTGRALLPVESIVRRLRHDAPWQPECVGPVTSRWDQPFFLLFPGRDTFDDWVNGLVLGPNVEIHVPQPVRADGVKPLRQTEDDSLLQVHHIYCSVEGKENRVSLLFVQMLNTIILVHGR